MIFIKTQAGQQVLKDRRGGLSSRQRSAFILFDGKRVLDEVLAATDGMGITMADVQLMVDQGLLEPLAEAEVAVAAQPPNVADVSDGAREPDQDAYRVAIASAHRWGLP